jgi:hypothetical protein
MIASAVLFMGLTFAAVEPDDRCACWTDPPGATGYRIYWSRIPGRWTYENSADLVADPTCPVPAGLTTPVVCARGWRDIVPDPRPSPVWFFFITATNAYGESDTEHGCIE